MGPLRICTLGDLLLDVIVRLEQPLAAGDDAVATTRTGAGGQAANVAAWAAALGAEARWVGKRAQDAAGEPAAAEPARAAGGRISVDLSSWNVIRAAGPAAFRERLDALVPDVVFGGEAEVQ